MRLADVLKVEAIQTDLDSGDKEDALRALARILAGSDQVLDEDTVYRVFSDRERLASTGVGSGVAIPHGRLDIDHFQLAMAICREGVPFDSVDGEPARIFVALLGPRENPAEQLKMLARISRVLKDKAVRARLLAAETGQDALTILTEEEGKH